MSFKEKAAVGILTFSIAFGGAGCADIKATPTTTITETTPSDINPSETSSDITIETTPTNTPTTRPTTEAPTPTPTTRPTTEAPTPIPTTRPTTEAPTPIPTQSELEGVAAERLQFTTDLLNLYDKSSKEYAPASNKIKDFVTRQQIINYGKGGEYIVKAGDVVKFENGTPAIALINCPDNVTTGFKKAIDIMEGYDSNYLKILTDNGLKAFMSYYFDPNFGDSAFTFNKHGLITWNATEFNMKQQKDTSGCFTWSIATEANGIKLLNLGGDYKNYVGFLKQLTASDCWWNLYKKTNQEYCLQVSNASYIFCKNYYNQVYAPVTFKDQKIQDLLANIRTNNLVKPFGGTWLEINQNISTRPDWN